MCVHEYIRDTYRCSNINKTYNPNEHCCLVCGRLLTFTYFDLLVIILIQSIILSLGFLLRHINLVLMASGLALWIKSIMVGRKSQALRLFDLRLPLALPDHKGVVVRQGRFIFHLFLFAAHTHFINSLIYQI